MNLTKTLAIAGAALLTGSLGAQADLLYDFSTGLDGFDTPGTLATPAGWAGGVAYKNAHTAGGWQVTRAKEFSWGPGGGSANQQLEMRALANQGANARIAFDVMVDGNSFPAGTAMWYQLTIIGNSDGTQGWTQREDQFATVATWHNSNDPTLLTLHVDQPFSWLGWQPGDTWFQLWTGSNSDGANPINFYFDNVQLYVVPEPSALALIGLGLAGLLVSRRK